MYASSEGISTLMLDRLGPGGQAGGSSRIENFIGFPAGLSGADLAMRGVLQMLKFGARIVAPVLVEKLTPARSVDELHALQLDCGAEIRCRVVLLALGVRWRRLEAAGADRFAGAGIYYACTTVEADLYDGADVAVVGGGNSAGQAAMFLAECCPIAHGALADPPHAGSRHVGIPVASASAQPPTCFSMNRPRSKRSQGNRHMEAITLKNNATRSSSARCRVRRCSSSSAPSRRRSGCRQRSLAMPMVIC